MQDIPGDESSHSPGVCVLSPDVPVSLQTCSSGCLAGTAGSASTTGGAWCPTPSPWGCGATTPGEGCSGHTCCLLHSDPGLLSLCLRLSCISGGAFLGRKLAVFYGSKILSVLSSSSQCLQHPELPGGVSVASRAPWLCLEPVPCTQTGLLSSKHWFNW